MYTLAIFIGVSPLVCMVSGHPQSLAKMGMEDWGRGGEGRKGTGRREEKGKGKGREGRGTLPDFYLD